MANRNNNDPLPGVNMGLQMTICNLQMHVAKNTSAPITDLTKTFRNSIASIPAEMSNRAFTVAVV